jgi:hypothetical protein
MEEEPLLISRAGEGYGTIPKVSYFYFRGGRGEGRGEKRKEGGEEKTLRKRGKGEGGIRGEGGEGEEGEREKGEGGEGKGPGGMRGEREGWRGEGRDKERDDYIYLCSLLNQHL